MPSIFDFTFVEIRDILISLLVLGFVFAYPEIITQPSFMLISLLGVGLAFIGHELSHRFVARKLGFYSAYKMWPEGLVFALILAIISGGRFVFAAPGAVIFSSYWILRRPTLKDIGLIGIAGTVFNISLMYICLYFYLTTGIVIFNFIGSINGWLAIFNLIPFGPLDGKKVMLWNWKIWLIALILAISGFVTLMFF
jgi:Zn-dependent protease